MNLPENDVKGIDLLAVRFQDLKKEIAKVIIGQDAVVDSVLMSIFSDGHSLLVGVPGLAKTLLVNTIASVLDLSFKRIQFTPDLMPSDITGSEIYDQQTGFKFIRGPIFTNILLADEINRTPPKTQAALLEAMQERALTAGGHNYTLDPPFFVLATQNPIEQEGTYPLPEAQLDRFMFNITVAYPKYEEELAVVKATTSAPAEKPNSVLNRQEILYFQQLIRRMPVTDHVLEYAVGLVTSTRPQTARAAAEVNQYVSWGAGPRASQYLILGAKCHAAVQGKYAPDREDVRAIALQVLRHRVVKNYKAEAEGLSIDQLLETLIKKAV